VNDCVVRAGLSVVCRSAVIEYIVVLRPRIRLPPDHPVAGLALAKEFIEQEPDVETHRFIANEKHCSGGFEDSMQIIERSGNPVQIGPHPALPAIHWGFPFGLLYPTPLVEPAGKDGRVQVDEINTLIRETAQQSHVFFATSEAAFRAMQFHDGEIRPLDPFYLEMHGILPSRGAKIPEWSWSWIEPSGHCPKVDHNRITSGGQWRPVAGNSPPGRREPLLGKLIDKQG
jgi:hypothetical protein